MTEVDKAAADALESGLVPGAATSNDQDVDVPPPPRHIPSAHFYRFVLKVGAKLGVSLDVRNPYHEDTRHRKETRFVWIPPASDGWVRNEWRDWMDEQKGNTSTAGIVKRRKVGAYWWGRRQKAPVAEKEEAWREEDGLIGLNLHGGAYAVGSAQEEDITANIPRRLIQHPRMSSVLSIEYRLTGFAPCPAQFLDALAGYHHLVSDLGVPPSKVIVFGDSAGGHLALALSRYLTVLNDEKVGIPRGVGLLSPWCDWTDQKKHGGKAHELVLRFMGSLPEDLIHESAYFSPATSREPFLPDKSLGPRFPDTLLTAGGEEFLLPSIGVLRGRLIDYGVKVEYLLAHGSSHDHLAAEGVPNIVWGITARERHRERERSWKVLGAWLDRLDTTSQ